MTVATGLRLRGADGRFTARLVPGGIDQIHGRAWVLVGPAGGPAERYDVEECRVYHDKVILKLAGIDSAARAAALVGSDISMPCKGLVDLPEGSYYIFELVGMQVRTPDGAAVGTVREVVLTAGTPLLAVRPAAGGGDDILVPAARSICTRIDRSTGTIVIDPPEGLLEL